MKRNIYILLLLLHGDKDNIVPLWCSEKYKETYGDRATLRVIPGVNHTITTHRSEVVQYAVDFFRQLFDKQTPFNAENDLKTTQNDIRPCVCREKAVPLQAIL